MIRLVRTNVIIEIDIFCDTFYEVAFGCINQVIKHSPYFDEKMQSVASEMYYYLLGLAQNARVISILFS